MLDLRSMLDNAGDGRLFWMGPGLVVLAAVELVRLRRWLRERRRLREMDYA